MAPNKGTIDIGDEKVRVINIGKRKDGQCDTYQEPIKCSIVDIAGHDRLRSRLEARPSLAKSIISLTSYQAD